MNPEDSYQQKEALLFHKLVQSLRELREVTSDQAYEVLSPRMASDGFPLDESDRLGIWAFLTHLEKIGFATRERRRAVPSSKFFYIISEKLIDSQPPLPPSLHP